MYVRDAVIAIELLAACQAIEFLRPLKTTRPLEEVYRLVRNVVKYAYGLTPSVTAIFTCMHLKRTVCTHSCFHHGHFCTAYDKVPG